MNLPKKDGDYLAEKGWDHSVTAADNMLCLCIENFALPSGFTVEGTTLLLRLSAGYPDVGPDMWWFNPAVVRVDGRPIPQTQVVQHFFGRQWQRWSRHFQPGQWKSGIDGLESFIALIQRELERAAT